MKLIVVKYVFSWYDNFIDKILCVLSNHILDASFFQTIDETTNIWINNKFDKITGDFHGKINVTRKLTR